MNQIDQRPFIVCQREWAMTGRDCETHDLVTELVAKCVAMIIHSSDFKVAALAHMDASINQKDVDQMITHIQAAAPSERKWTVIFIGGQTVENRTNRFVRGLIEEWQKNPDWTLDTRSFAKEDTIFTVSVDALKGTYCIKDMVQIALRMLEVGFRMGCSLNSAETTAAEAVIKKEDELDLPWYRRKQFTLAKDFCSISPKVNV
ncbi:MAG TPA: hypothetical protein VLE89_00890 [Chlamydiales bacterium]|nr:hypothetical protein [Chlamydiales bacterium]